MSAERASAEDERELDVSIVIPAYDEEARIAPTIEGHAVRVGMLVARGTVRVMCDADGSMPATERARLLAPIADGACAIAIGSRYAGNTFVERQPAWRRAWSRLLSIVAP